MQKQLKRLTFACEVCGKVVTTRADRPRKYCSPACVAIGRTGTHRDSPSPLFIPRVQTTCKVCGKVFSHSPRSPRTYCSHACAGRGRIGQRGRHTVRTTPLIVKVQTACAACGKVFSHYPKTPRIYCSHKCGGSKNALRNTHYQTTCEICGKVFETIPSVAARFCSQTCFGKMQSTRVGPLNPMHGRKFDRPKDMVDLTCPVCQGIFSVKRSHVRNRRCCSRACLGAWLSAHMRGENSPTWKGGYEPYYGPNWRKQRILARQRDNYTCQRCGKHEDNLRRALDVHHCIPFRVFGIRRYLEANDLSNLVSYCGSCHLTVEHEQYTRPNPRP